MNPITTTLMEKANEKIDQFLLMRKEASAQMEKAIAGLYEMGVRFYQASEDGGAPEVTAAQNLIPRYEVTLQDFEWKAIYDDGGELDQYGNQENHFGDIDQSRLAKIMFIGNFEIDTSNIEKRPVITMDFKTGLFEFLNCGPMDVRGKLTRPCVGDKKLILFRRKRETFSAGVNGKKDLEMTGDQIVYIRYYLGYETSDRKVLICIYPNGDVGIEENK